MQNKSLASVLALTVVTLTSVAATENGPSDRMATIRVVAVNASVRIAADPNAMELVKVPGGTVLEVNTREGAWFAVWLPDDPPGVKRLGFIAASDVELFDARQPAATRGEPAATRVRAAAADKATVYVYRVGKFMGRALSPSVFVDDNKVADMSNARYFALRLDPGAHIIRSNEKDSEIDQVWEPGKVYFLKITIVSGVWKGHGQISTMSEQQARREMATLSPLDSDDVANGGAGIVVLDPIKEAQLVKR